MLTRHPTKGVRPERPLVPSAVEGSGARDLPPISDTGIYPEEHRDEGPSSQWARIPVLSLSRSSVQMGRQPAVSSFAPTARKSVDRGLSVV